jgi:predicted secreted acid phosphatase
MLIGDNLGDFVDAKDNLVTQDQRKDMVQAYQEYWAPNGLCCKIQLTATGKVLYTTLIIPCLQMRFMRLA